MTFPNLSRQEYLSQLESRLMTLPEHERKNALNYYDNHILSSGDEAATIASLGAPSEVAADILASYVKRSNPQPLQGTVIMDDEPPKRGFNLQNHWWILLIIGVLAFPAIVGLGGGLIGLIAGIGGALIAIAVSGFTMIATGTVSVILSVFVLFQDVGFGLIAAGTGFVLIGIGILFVKLTFAVFGWAITLIRKTVRRLQNGRTHSAR